MFRSDRLRQLAVRGCLIAGVVLLTAAVGPCQGEEAPQGPDKTRPAENGPTEVQTKADDVAASASQPTEPEHLPRIATALEAISAKTETKDEKERAKRDLNAQERMAFWALIMSVAAVIQTGLTALGVWFIYDTLKATKRTLRAAVRSNRVASKANDVALAGVAAADRAVLVSQETAKKQLRPYLSVQHVGFRWTKQDGDVEKGNLHSIVQLNNSGSTPAVNVTMKSNFWTDDYPIKSIIPPSFSDTQEQFTVHPGANRMFHFRHPGIVNKQTLESHIASKDSKKRFFFFCRIEYFDIDATNTDAPWTTVNGWSHTYNTPECKAMQDRPTRITVHYEPGASEAT